MYQWRVTKYNPRSRNRKGAYLAEDWTSVSDIGDTFNNHQLELDAYLAVENNYVSTAMQFLKESGLSSLYVVELETDAAIPSIVKEIGLDKLLYESSEIYEKKQVYGKEIERICRLNLRNLTWCKLEEKGKFFIHFGYDYYMYIGSFVACINSIIYAQKVDLFVEKIKSPYY